MYIHQILMVVENVINPAEKVFPCGKCQKIYNGRTLKQYIRNETVFVRTLLVTSPIMNFIFFSYDGAKER